jgi:hypothetical protein
MLVDAVQPLVVNDLTTIAQPLIALPNPSAGWLIAKLSNGFSTVVPSLID